ncbi:MAG TPA: hypothetical protein VKV20_16770 [Ktedonobacteraceae bacterium]|jgi:hypothetical protein|nr:hypothetical protein [Ktedonobacteraceae bacterium]
MFTTEFRDHVRQRVLELVQADPRVIGGALTGSTALGAGDKWSDVDIAFGIADGNRLETALDDWTQALDQEFGVVNYFDLPAGKRIFRVFLLPNGLEIDISVMPPEEFGAYGPEFRVLFGTPRQAAAMPQPEASYLIGLGWLHVLHARASIERNKPWKAEYWISGVRDQVIALACLRLGENAIYGRGVDRLPAVVTDPLAGALVCSLDTKELRRALAVATLCLIAELEQWDKPLSARLSPLLREFGTFQNEGEQT